MRRSLLAVISAVAVVAIAIVATWLLAPTHNTLPIAQAEKEFSASLAIEAKAAAPVLKVIGRRTEVHSGMSYDLADLVVINPLDVPLNYIGDPPSRTQSGDINPRFARLLKTSVNPQPIRDDIWDCGTELAPRVIPPHHAGRFSAMLRPGELAMQVEVSIAWVDSHGLSQRQVIRCDEISAQP